MDLVCLKVKHYLSLQTGMKNKITQKEGEYLNVDEAVEAVFVNKNERKKMFFALFLLAIAGCFIVVMGTYFLSKQNQAIGKSEDFGIKSQNSTSIVSKSETKDVQEIKQKALEVDNESIQSDGNVSEAKIFFVGDLMLDRYNRELMERKSEKWMTEKVVSLFEKNDLNIANLEGPVTDSDSISVGSEEGSKNNYVFTFDPEHTNKFLKYNKIDLLNLGNNHILNFGKDGLAQTKGFILKNNFEYFGDIQGEPDEYIEKNINGLKIAFVSYDQFGGKGYTEIEKTVVKLEDANDFVVVYTHWGVEYELEESADQRQTAHELIDAGADLIIGSHPHVVQPVEIYKDKVIFYSLGNFVFDQYFSADTMTGLGVKVLMKNDGELDFELVPLELQRNGQIEFATEKGRADLLNRILKTEAVSKMMNFQKML